MSSDALLFIRVGLTAFALIFFTGVALSILEDSATRSNTMTIVSGTMGLVALALLATTFL